MGNKIYLVVVICALISAILDVVASLDYVPIPVLFTLNTFFFMSRGATAFSLFFYALNLGKYYNRLKKNKWGHLLIHIPYFILLVFLVINYFNKCIFDYKEGPQYVRGDLVFIAYAVSYLYLAASIIIIFLRRKYHQKAQVIAVFFAFLLQIGSSIFQFLVKDILVEMFIAAITLLTLSLFMEGPENYIDYKTKGLNFRSFTADITQHLEDKDSFSILFIHVTNSSSLYNLYPHEEAIRFIHNCNNECSSTARKLDNSLKVYFLGNSTFAYLYNDSSKDKDIKDYIRDVFSRPMFHNGISFLFTCKLCTINCPKDTKDATSIIAFSTTYYDLTDSNDLDITPFRKEEGNVLFELDHILERAINNQSFSIYYQGIYSLKENKFTSAEALIRLKDPTFGMIMPSFMIPYAESRGKIFAIGKIVIEKCFAFFVNNLRGKINYIEINLSPVQLLNSSLLEVISSLADKYDIKPEEIVFEITESAAVVDDPTSISNIKAIREQGYGIAIDDFGTGYSNFARISKLDISILKFDKSMSDLLENGGQNAFIEGLISIVKKQNIKILFEGVESKELIERLSMMGVDYIQGYYFSKVIPEEDFLKLIDK